MAQSNSFWFYCFFWQQAIEALQFYKGTDAIFDESIKPDPSSLVQPKKDDENENKNLEDHIDDSEDELNSPLKLKDFCKVYLKLLPIDPMSTKLMRIVSIFRYTTCQKIIFTCSCNGVFGIFQWHLHHNQLHYIRFQWNGLISLWKGFINFSFNYSINIEWSVHLHCWAVQS